MDDKQEYENNITSKSEDYKRKVLEMVPFQPTQPSRPKGAKPFLVQDKKFIGQYVAMPSFNDRCIIASGPNRTVVLNKANSLGFKHPVIHYVSSSE